MAQKARENMPNDYISRESAIDLLCRSRDTTANQRYVLKRQIERIPAADVVEVVHARWWPDNMDAGCTNCGSGMPRNPDGSQEESEYCPNCGAKMDGGENHAD
jgi:hypothetical protein